MSCGPNVLIVRTSSLGDVVRVMPAITDARAAIPNISFDWVVEEAFSEIPKWHEAVKNVIPVAWRRWRKNIIKAFYSGELLTFISILRQKEYDLVIDAQGLIKSAVITKMTRGPSYGYDKNSAREKQAAFFYENVFAIPLDQHIVTYTRSLFAAALNYTLPNTAPNYDINKKISSLSQKNNEKYLVFCHGVSSDNRCWNEQKWTDLAKLVTSNSILNNLVVYLPWGNEMEFARAQRISHNCTNFVKVLPKLSLSEIAILLRDAICVISVDTGLGHIAAALNTPIISLYGPTIPRLAGTVGMNQENVTHMVNFEKLEATDVYREINRLSLLTY